MKEITLQFIGSGDAFGSGGRFQTCFYVESENTKFLIDCGASSLVALKKAGIRTDEIDVIVLSHLHGDHFGGVPFLLLENWHLHRRTRPLIIAAPQSARHKIERALEVFFPGAALDKMSYPVEFVRYKGGKETTAGDLKITPYPVIHSEGSNPYGVRIECEGKTIAYSGDTEWTDNLLLLARDADVFICEMYAFEKGIKNHMVYQKYLEYKSRFTCRRFIMTHMGDEMLARLGEVDTEYAEDGKKIVV